MAFYDPLSRLPNKSKLLDTYQRETPRAGVFIQFSLEGLSMMNSIYGTEKTDHYIKHLAKYMRAHAQNENALARLSGNDFLWIFEGLSVSSSLQHFKDLVLDLTQFETSHHARQILKIYAGYLVVSNKSYSMGEILEKTAIALEQARLQDSSVPVPYDKASEALFFEQENLKRDLLQAIRDKDFSIYYQEKVDTQLGSVIGVEALARWSKAGGDSIAPNTFIPLLKTINAAMEFDLMIIEKVFKEYPNLSTQYDHPISVSINISPLSLITQAFIDGVMALCDQKLIEPTLVYFELTEDAFFESYEAANDGIEQLRTRGFKISIDDFGSGYTALSYIFKLKFDELKMDRSFVHQLSQSHVNCAILKTLVSLRDVYHFSIVAEGVETQDECALLQQMDCWQIQGYLFSKPSPCVCTKVVNKDEPHTRT